jgi:hypothetical protein
MTSIFWNSAMQRSWSRKRALGLSGWPSSPSPWLHWKNGFRGLRKQYIGSAFSSVPQGIFRREKDSSSAVMATVEGAYSRDAGSIQKARCKRCYVGASPAEAAQLSYLPGTRQ